MNIDLLKSSMIPSYGDCIRSFYLNSKYARVINLTKLVKENSCPLEQVVQTAQKITRDKTVQEVLSQPLVYKPDEFQKKNRVLQEKNFTLLSTKPVIKIMENFVIETEITPYYNVSEHKDLDGWIIKAGARRIPEDQFLMGPTDLANNEMVQFSPFESLQRLHMNRKFKAIAKQIKDVKVVVPEEYAIPFKPCYAKNLNDLTQRYFIISRKLDVLTTEKTIEYIKTRSEKDQIKLAKAYIKLISQGYCDASFDNLRITKDGKLAVLDTEPGGSLNGMHSIQKCTRVGLFTLYTLSKQKIGADEAFTKEVKKAYLSSLKDISVPMILLSLLIIPLIIILIHSIVLRIKIKRAVDALFEKQQAFSEQPEIQEMQKQIQTKMLIIDCLENPEDKKTIQGELQKLSKKLQEKKLCSIKPFQDRYYQVIDGIPWKNPEFKQWISYPGFKQLIS